MEASSQSMTTFLENPKTIFEIPVYQRNYEWNIKQCNKLFDDLELLALHPDRTHFLGTIVYIPTNNISSRGNIQRIIDGQQRITSFMLLLKAFSSLNSNRADEINDEYLMNKHLDKNNNFKLKPVEKDRKPYMNVMNNINNDTKPSKIIDNYNHFKKLINKSKYSVDDLFNALIRMNIAYIKLDNDSNSENPQVIFEAINSTGVSLSDADLIRNFLLMGVSTELQDTLYHNYWIKIENMLSNKIIPEFVRYYLEMIKHKSVSKNKVYEEYKKFIISNEYTSESAIKELYKYSIDYSKLKYAKFNNEKLNKILQNIAIMGKTVAYPYFLKLLKLMHNKQLSLSTLLMITKEVESYLYRTLICKYKTNGQNNIMTSLCSPSKGQDELERLEICLLKHNFPTDKEVKETLLNNPLGKTSIIKMTLKNIELELNNNNVDFQNAGIEHIMPSKLSDDWRISIENADNVNDHFGKTIGNLTLIKTSQNTDDYKYNKKKELYKNSDMMITNNIPNQYLYWNKDSIINRSKYLINILIHLWPRPNRKINFNRNDNIGGEYRLSDSPNVTRHKPYKLIIDDENWKVSSWKETLILLLDYAWNYSSEDFDLLRRDIGLQTSIFRPKNQMHSPSTLNNGELIETNFNSLTILSIMKKIARIYNISDAISYVIN